MYNWYSQKYKLLILLIFPIAIPTVLAIFTDIYTNGFINSARAIEDVGTSTTATLLGVNLSLIIASLGIAFTNKKTNKESILQIILVVSGIIGIICVVHLINRTGIIIAVITSVIILVASFRKYGLFKRISIIIVLISLVYISMPLIDGYQVADSYENREEDETYTANSAGGRTVRWMDGLEKTFTQPLGGGVYKFGKRYYAHNLWLDVSELTGIIPFLMLLTASIINLRKNYLIVRSKNTPPFLKSWLICINLGFFLSCFMEPIMEGAFTFAIMYFCFWGMTNMFYNDFVVSSQIENE